jgi:hypothetical protein
MVALPDGVSCVFSRFSVPTDTGIYLEVCPNFPDECAPDGSFCVCLLVTR